MCLSDWTSQDFRLLRVGLLRVGRPCVGQVGVGQQHAVQVAPVGLLWNRFKQLPATSINLPIV